MRTMNKAEQQALFRLYNRDPNGSKTYREFRRRAMYDGLVGCWIIGWCKMFIGIEQDGYTHS